MEPQGCDKEDDLEQVMQRLAAGDEAAVVTLYERYGSSIAAAVRHVARSRPGRLDDDDVGGAVLDVCFELARVAGGWSPAGGALPWVWARHRVAGAVDRALGQQAQSLDDQRTDVRDRLVAGVAPGPSAPEPSLLDALNRLAAQDVPRRPALVDATTVPAGHGSADEPSLVEASTASAGSRSGAGGSAGSGSASWSSAGERSLVDAKQASAARSGSGEPLLEDAGTASAGSGSAARPSASWGSAGERSLADVKQASAPGGSSAHGSSAHGSATLGSRAGAPGYEPSPLDPATGRSEGETRSWALVATPPERIDLTGSPDAAASVGVGLLAEALDRGGVSTRDRELLLEYAYEKHSGNSAPATSVAPMFDMREVSVRQAARRTRERLLRLAASEERFAPLADLPLLA